MPKKREYVASGTYDHPGIVLKMMPAVDDLGSTLITEYLSGKKTPRGKEYEIRVCPCSREFVIYEKHKGRWVHCDNFEHQLPENPRMISVLEECAGYVTFGAVSGSRVYIFKYKESVKFVPGISRRCFRILNSVDMLDIESRRMFLRSARDPNGMIIRRNSSTRMHIRPDRYKRMYLSPPFSILINKEHHSGMIYNMTFLYGKPLSHVGFYMFELPGNKGYSTLLHSGCINHLEILDSPDRLRVDLSLKMSIPKGCLTVEHRLEFHLVLDD